MIICEIGLNHLGVKEYADQYIKEIVSTKADALAFQIPDKSVFEIENYKNMKLEEDYYREASKKTKENNKKFGVGIADMEMVDFFISLDADFFKVFSHDILNKKLITKLVSDTDKPIFVSTGMSDMDEISRFCSYIDKHRNRFTLIHTQLNHEINDVNLKAIPYLHKKFKLPVAFGNHCANLNALYVSLAFEPSDIFVYVKGNRTTEHPDEQHAIPLDNLREVINNMKELKKTIGESVKIKMENLIIKKGNE